MALHSYQALSKAGEKKSGYIDAPSAQDVKNQLVQQGLYPVEILLVADQSTGSWWRRLLNRRLSVKDKILLTKQLAVLLKAGVPLLSALELLTEQFTGNLRRMLIVIKDRVKEGISFADALQAYGDSFEPLYVQLVKAGEASGKLEAILDRLTSHLERQEEMRKRVQGALFYPIIQLVISFAVVMVLMVYVVPGMSASFAQQGRTLPTATRILIAISDALRAHYLVILVCVLAVGFGYRVWRSSESGSLLVDRIKLKIPMVSYFVRTKAVVQFSQTLGMLLQSGVNLAEALDIVVKIIDNRLLARALREARDKIIKQGRIAEYLRRTDIFPPIAVYLIKTGEDSGQLDTMLLAVGDNYSKELAELSDKLSATLSPLLLVAMALIIGFIVMAIAGPMMKMSTDIEEFL